MAASFRQQALTVVLPVQRGEEAALERWLETEGKTLSAGLARAECLHFARLAMLPSAGVGGSRAGARLLLETSFDGEVGSHIEELAREVGGVLADALARCEPPRSGRADSFAARLSAGSRRAAAFFSAHGGRSARQIRDDARLRDAFRRWLLAERPKLGGLDPLAIVGRARQELGARAPGERPHGVPRSREPSRPALLRALGLAPLLARASVHDVTDFVRALWTDAKLDESGVAARLDALGLRPEAATQNAFLHVVEVKPGRFRRRGLKAALRHVAAWLEDGGAARRWDTCHSARWVELGDGRLLFSCHHDGSLEAELGAWVERLSFPGSLLWSYTKDFPPSFGAVFGGTRDEARFKAWARAKCLPSQLEFGAYPRLSVGDVARGAELGAIFGRELDLASARRALELV